MEILIQDVGRNQAIPDEARFNRIFDAALRILEDDYEARAHSQIQEVYGITAAEVSDLEMTLSELDVALDWQADKPDDEVAHAWAAAMWEALEQQIVARRLERKVSPPDDATAERDGLTPQPIASEALAHLKALSGSGAESDVFEGEARAVEESIASGTATPLHFSSVAPGAPMRSPAQRQPSKAPPKPPKDKSIDVIEAIVHMMSNRGLAGDTGPQGENLWSPRYATEVAKTIREPAHVALLWTWFNLAVGHESTTGDEAKVADAHAKTLALFASMTGTERSAKNTVDLAKRYMQGYDAISQTKARERVDKMTDVGVAKASVAATIGATEDEKLQAATGKARKVLNDAASAMRRMGSPYTTAKKLSEAQAKALAAYESDVKAYQAKIDAGVDPAMPWPESVKRARSMNPPDALHFLKGGLDAVSAIVSVADPDARAKLFRARSNIFGTVARAADINKVCWQFVSGSVAVVGGGAYAALKLAGKAQLAEKFLDSAVKGVSNVGTVLNVVGLVHGAFVLLDPDATSDEKVEAGVEMGSSAIGLAGYGAKAGGARLAWATRWSGPISASLTINYYQFKYLAGLKHEARVGLSRLDWVYCYKAAKAAAIEAQTWQRRLAVTTALLAVETDPRRKAELQKNAAAYRFALIEQQIKPFVEARVGSKNLDDDAASCGPAFNKRLRLLVGQLGSAASDNLAALGAGADFLSTIERAFIEWDQIVMEGL